MDTRPSNSRRARLPLLLTALPLLLPVALNLGCENNLPSQADRPVRTWIDLVLQNYRAFEDVEQEVSDWQEALTARESAVKVTPELTDDQKKQREQARQDRLAAREYYHEALYATPRWEITNASNPNGQWEYEVTFWFYELDPVANPAEDARGKDRYELKQRQETYSFRVADLDGWRLTGDPRAQGNGRLLSHCFPPAALLPDRH